jgi:hypothetical protein
MSVMLPHKKSTTFLLGLLLIDLPVFAAVAVLGVVYGFKNTYWTISDWRMEHPWSLIPSVILAAWLIRKWVKS